MISFYFDEMMSHAVAEGLRQQGYDVVMAIEVDMVGRDDDTEHLPFATENERTMVTQDKPFAGRTLVRTDHAGLICWTGGQRDIGGQIRALSDFSDKHEPDAVRGQVFWLK